MVIKKYFRPLKSKSLLVIIALVWISVIGFFKPWEQNLIINDVVSYYGYLPATFINKDLTLKFAENKPFYLRKFWPEKAPNGGKVIKTTMGLSVLYAPFFFMGHIAAHVLHEDTNGYSPHYQKCLLLSCLFYIIIGFYFLRKLLLIFFSERITHLTMLSVFLGTNLLYYSTLSGLMSHGYLFTCVTVFVYLVVKWHAHPKLRTAFFIGLTGGLITLIRPTMVLCFLIVVLYNVYNKQTLREKMQLFKYNIPSLICMAVFAFLVILPQLIYWKYITGSWFFFSYVGERFYWSSPHIVEGLFGFRKGWLIYTPIMAFAVAGIFFLRKSAAAFFISLVVMLPLLVYVFFSWWAWWYGGSFGQRAFVDFYGLFSIPLAAFYTQVFQRKWILKTIVIFITILFISLNLFQTWQFQEGLLHYDSMTMKAYFTGFFNTDMNHPGMEKFYYALEAPDYDRARKGLPEHYSEAELRQIIPSDVITIKAYNQMMVGCEAPETKTISAVKNNAGREENFYFTFLNDHTLVIKSVNGHYLTVAPAPPYKLYATADTVGVHEKFEWFYQPNGSIALKAFNNKYVSVEEENPFELDAGSKEITEKEMLRVFVN